MNTDDLRADCTRCVGLCCVAPVFSASADFAIDKAAGVPCPNLADDLRCSIHARLREEGFRGCAAYDCFGAGQRITRTTFAGADWRGSRDLATRMFAAFGAMRVLHQLLWYLADARSRPEAAAVLDELTEAARRIERLTNDDADVLASADVAGLKRDVDPLLRRTSELVRAGGSVKDLSGADLIGTDLRGTDLRRADLRNARMVGADLSGADLRAADFIGADLRGVNLSDADLTGGIFLTQPQVDTAIGHGGTRIPPWLQRPRHWPV